MFGHDFQGGAFFEVFIPQGKDPVANWRLTGPGIKKNYDKEVKSYVYNLEGSPATTRMQLPKDIKNQLGLIQRYLILQVYVARGTDFSVDLGITDLANQKRRLVLSTTYKETQLNPLHSKIPLGMIKRATWLNLSLDLLSLVGETWRGQTYKAVESICISANCKLRKVFTMKAQPADSTDDEELLGFTGTNSGVELDSIPKACTISHDVKQEIQVINMKKVRYFEGKGKPTSSESGGSATSRHSINYDTDLNSSGGKRQSSDYHIAFGTKILGSGRVESRKGSGGTTSRQQNSSHSRTRSDDGSDSAGSSRAPHPPRPDRLSVESAKGQTLRDRKNSDPGTNMEDPEITVDKESLRTSHTWTDGADNKEEIPFVRPHPPSKPSSVKSRKPRVKSAGKERSGGKERTPHQGHSVKGASPQSSYHSSQMTNHQRAPPPSQVANDQEEERFMKEMQQSVQQEHLKSESESDPGSHNTSVNQDEDSLTEVISTLNEGIRNYEESEEEDPQEDDHVVYTYSSAPKLPPNVSHSGKTRKSQQPYTKKITSMRKMEGTESRLEMDFARVGSTDEEDSSRSDLWRHESGPVLTETSPKHSSMVAAGQQSKENGYLNIPAAGQLKSPVNSQSRVSINKSSLRVIPKEEVRRSGGSKAYHPSKYEMIPDLSDSFEAQMLMQLKKETMEEGMESSEDEENRRQNGGLTRSKINYGDDDLSDNSDDTSTSTMRHGALEVKTHNYQDEMKILSQEFLTQSNPRDWGSVFSPPIVLPSNTTNGASKKYNLSPGNKDLSPQYYSANTKTQHTSSESQRQDPGDVEEDKLELLFDPVLNVYFDPKSCTYYELKT